jgi:uncharacterized protein (DUF2249 family)
MNDVVIASSEADASAAAAVEQHHARMAGELAVLVETLVAATARGDAGATDAARAELVGWCDRELVPHALAEEAAMYPAAHRMAEGRLLVDGMLAEHRVITGLVREMAGAPDGVRAAAAATALRVMFDAHLAKENELVLPLLTAAAEVSVAELLGGMHELLGGEPGGAEPGCGGQECSCGEVDTPGHPELDAREIPHAIRHATIFGALDAVRPGGGLVLIAPHDPLPLLAQVERRSPGVFEVSYLERGPQAWRLLFAHRAAA